jgi:hypothetical protein
MTNEQVLADAVQAWVRQVVPGDWAVAERATLVALHCYRQGSTVREAYQQANGFVQSWMHHPSHQAPDRHVVLRLIS